LRRIANSDQEDVHIWYLAGDQEDDKGSAKMHPNVYLDSPEDDFEDIKGYHGIMFLVPAYKTPSRDLIGLLVQRKGDGHFRLVGLSVIPRYVGAKRGTSMDEIFGDNNEKTKGKKKMREIIID